MKEIIFAMAFIIFVAVFGILTIRALFKDAPDFESPNEGLCDNEKEGYHKGSKTIYYEN